MNKVNLRETKESAMIIMTGFILVSFIGILTLLTPIVLIGLVLGVLSIVSYVKWSSLRVVYELRRGFEQCEKQKNTSRKTVRRKKS